MTATAMSFLAGGIGLFIHIASVACIGRIARGRSLIVVHGAAFALGLLGLIASTAIMPEVIRLWLGLSLLVGGAAVLLFISATFAKSVSVRIVRYLVAEGDGPICVEALSATLANRLIRNRADVLLATGLVEQDGENLYRMSQSGRVVANRVDAVRRAFGVQSVILYGDSSDPR
ncbi:MAG: hypothetical protein MI824_23775 [Hyphomicrobiales bacterium]|nr:hypothetical protein [Hyphomicrobiales bacterium]